MNHFKIVERLCRIHDLIQQEATGPPGEFAKRLRISRRQFYNDLEELKDWGAAVKYSRIRRTFFYTNNFHITLIKLHLSRNHTGEQKEEKNEK
ncbi:MAG: helix-turn-helix domain-containing protein [Bacteroidales bacterium]|nr:helix-turn-helix domain-containing protein [Bacteroidales bacterium]